MIDKHSTITAINIWVLIEKLCASFLEAVTCEAAFSAYGINFVNWTLVKGDEAECSTHACPTKIQPRLICSVGWWRETTYSLKEKRNWN